MTDQRERLDEHDEVAGLVAVYALDAVADPDEREQVERHLDGCARCREELAQHLAVAAAVVDDGPAPAALWDRIAGEAFGDVQPAHDAGARVVPLRSWRRLGASVLSAAAVIALVLVGASVLSDDPRATPAELAAAVLDDADTRVLPLVDESGTVLARAGLRPDGTAAIVATDDLPSLDDGVYQLWGAGDEVVSLGLMGSDGALVARVDPSVSALVLTAEPPGGSVVARGPAVAQVALA